MKHLLNLLIILSLLPATQPICGMSPTKIYGKRALTVLTQPTCTGATPSPYELARMFTEDTLHEAVKYTLTPNNKTGVLSTYYVGMAAIDSAHLLNHHKARKVIPLILAKAGIDILLNVIPEETEIGKKIVAYLDATPIFQHVKTTYNKIIPIKYQPLVGKGVKWLTLQGLKMQLLKEAKRTPSTVHLSKKLPSYDCK